MNLVNDISLANIVSWVIFGLITGMIAHLIDSRDVHGGILATTITGILGAVFGGFLANALFGINITGFNLQSFAIAVAGALLLVILQRVLFSRNEHIKTQATNLQ